MFQFRAAHGQKEKDETNLNFQHSVHFSVLANNSSKTTINIRNFSMARRKQQVLQEVLTNQEEWDNFMTRGGLSVIDCHQVNTYFHVLLIIPI